MDNFIFEPNVLWLTILVLAIISALSALKLSKNIATLVDHTGLAGGVAGLVILSGVSSLPELVTIITASVNSKPALAFSDIIGANALTGVMIAITYLVFKKHAAKDKVTKSNITALFFALGIYLIVSTSILLVHFDIGYPVFNIGVTFGLPLLLAMISYFLMIYFTKDEDEEQVDEDKGVITPKPDSIPKLIWATVGYSMILIGGAVILTLATSVAAEPEGYNLGHGVAGALILATTTSIPEIVSIITLTRLGRRNMAIAGVVGSHVFNFSMLFIGELVYKGTIIDSIITEETFKQFIAFMILVITITVLLIINFLTPTNKVKNKSVVSYIIIGIFIGAWVFINTAL